jgi:hypothetical protein
MLRATDCLVVARDPYLSVDLSVGLEEMFPGIRVVATASVAEALVLLPKLPRIGLVVLDAALNRDERNALAIMLLAQGARVAVVGGLQADGDEPSEDGIRRFHYSDELLAWCATLMLQKQA